MKPAARDARDRERLATDADRLAEYVAAAAEPKGAEPSKPEPPKITHENLYQMEELVKQGADPNAPYWLYPGLPCTTDVYPLYAAIRTGRADLVKRLLALGAKPRGNQLKTAASLKGGNALKMVRMLVEAGMDPDVASGMVPTKGRGCKLCSETGFKGRIALYEVMELKDELKEFILNGASSLELKREAMRLGMKSLRQSALSKLAEGTTTLSEVFRVSTADN